MYFGKLTVLIFIAVKLASLYLNAEGQDVFLTSVRAYEGAVYVHNAADDTWLPAVYLHYDLDIGEYVTKWDIKDTNAVCNQLGYNGASWFGYVDNLNWPWDINQAHSIYDVDCDDDDTYLYNCTKTILSVYGYFDFAFVKCNYADYMGCYNISYFNPQLESDANMTVQHCVELCRLTTFPYAGLTMGDSCFCSGDLGPPGLEEEKLGTCYTFCVGDANNICGNDYAASLYRTTFGACGGIITEPTTIYSPGFPGTNPVSINCTWTISLTHDEPYSIALLFLIYELDDEQDSLIITEMVDGQTKEINMNSSFDTLYTCTNDVQVSLQSLDQDGGLFAIRIQGILSTCQSPLTIPDGNFYIDGPLSCPYFDGDVIQITCKPGYELFGRVSHNIECHESGLWNNSMPKCIIVDCGDPGPVDNAIQQGNNYLYESTVSYICQDGYYSNTSTSVSCTAEGIWTDKPYCYENAVSTVTSGPDKGTTVNSDEISTTVNADEISTTVNADEISTTVNSDEISTTVNSDEISTTGNSGVIVTTGSSGVFSKTTVSTDGDHVYGKSTGIDHVTTPVTTEGDQTIGKSIGTAVIIGIVAGVVALILLVLAIAVYLVKRRPGLPVDYKDKGGGDGNELKERRGNDDSESNMEAVSNRAVHIDT